MMLQMRRFMLQINASMLRIAAFALQIDHVLQHAIRRLLQKIRPAALRKDAERLQAGHSQQAPDDLQHRISQLQHSGRGMLLILLQSQQTGRFSQHASSGGRLRARRWCR
jgi:hypothetical protein